MKYYRTSLEIIFQTKSTSMDEFKERSKLSMFLHKKWSEKARQKKLEEKAAYCTKTNIESKK